MAWPLAALALALATSAPVDPAPRPPPRGLVQGAVAAALAVPGGRAELLDLSDGLPEGCVVERAELPKPVAASGRFALRLAGTSAQGRPCQAWVWARVRVSAPTLVTRRGVAPGEPLVDAVGTEERAVEPGRPPLAALPEGATAARALPAGARVELELLQVGPRPGGAVAVVLRTGVLEVEQLGRAVPCARGRACALLPSGRRVEGRWHGGRIELDPS